MLSVFAILLLTNNLAYAKRAATSVCDPRVPVVSLEKAINLVRLNHQSSALSDKPIFIDLAQLKCVNNIHTWHIGYRLKAYESGHFIVKVSMDGSLTTGKVIKDG